MRWRRGILAVCAALAIAPRRPWLSPARSAAPTSVETSHPRPHHRALSVQFHGDASAGCARWGLCGYSGTVTWQPPPPPRSRSSARCGGHPQLVTALLPSLLDEPPFVDGETTASVRGGRPGLERARHPLRRCDGRRPGSAVVVATRHGPLGTSDCPPPAVATGDALRGPARRRRPSAPPRSAPSPLRRSRTGARPISLAAAQVLNAHGFAGSITSTIVLHLGRPGRTRTESDGHHGRDQAWARGRRDLPGDAERERRRGDPRRGRPPWSAARWARAG